MSQLLVQLKKSGESGNTPVNLNHGEIALNYADGKLYYKNDVDSIVYINNQESFSTISSNGELILATSPTDILTLTPNNGVSIVTDVFNKRIFVGVNQDQLTDLVHKSGDTMTGDLTSSANISANNLIVNNTLYSGLATRSATPLPNLVGQFTGNSSTYVQVNAQNIDEHGSADFVVTSDVGDDETFYIDMGIQGSQLNQGTIHALDGYLLVQGNTGQIGGNLVIGTISGTPGQEIKFIVGGYEDDNVVVIMSSSNTTFVNDVVVDGEISGPTILRINNFTQSAYDEANSAYVLAQQAYNQANTGGGGGGGIATQFYFPTGDYGLITESLTGGDGMEYISPIYDMRIDPLVAGLISVDLGYTS